MGDQGNRITGNQAAGAIQRRADYFTDLTTGMQDFRHLFIIGAPKAGTTTLAELLARHPWIHQGAQKEPRFFTDFADRTWSGPGCTDFIESMTADLTSYLALYAKAPRGSWRLDASTDYLSNATARDRLIERASTSRVKLICMLRDPVERVISEYRHTLRDLLETLPLRDALTHEVKRRREGWQPLFWHLRRSRFQTDVVAYKAAFGDDMLLLDFAELRNPRRLESRIWRFLGLSPASRNTRDKPTADSKAPVRNESRNYRSPALQHTLFSPTLRRTARLIAPRALRQWLRLRLERANRTRFQPDEADLRFIFKALEHDIRACLADPAIPTDSWALSRRLARAVADEGDTFMPPSGQGQW